MGPANEAEALLGKEALDHIWPKRKACPSIVLTPADNAGIRIRPKKIREHARLRRINRPLQSAQRVQPHQIYTAAVFAGREQQNNKGCMQQTASPVAHQHHTHTHTHTHSHSHIHTLSLFRSCTWRQAAMNTEHLRANHGSNRELIETHGEDFPELD